MSKRDRTGEYISLYWDDYKPDWYAVRGHVTPEQYAAEMAREEPDIKLDTPRHTWAHWAMVGWESRTDKRRNLMLCDKPGRGRFPVTVAEEAIPSIYHYVTTIENPDSTMSDSGQCWSFRTAVITEALDIHVDARPPYSGRETARPNCYKRPRYVRVPKDALTRDGYWK